MSPRLLDLAPPRQHCPDKVKPKVQSYPDLSRLVETVTVSESTAIIQHPAVAIVEQPRSELPAIAKPHLKPKLRTVRRGVFRSGISWFLVLAVLSSSSIGVATIIQQGRAAKQTVTQEALSAQKNFSGAAEALAAR